MGKRIGIFGGSFDPPHNGHLYIGEDLIDRGYVDAVWYLPCYNSLHGKNITDGHVRLDMLWSLLGNSRLNRDDSNHQYPPKFIKEHGLWPCPFEIKNEMTGKSLDVITEMFKYYRDNGHADDTFHMIIGMDNAENIHKFAEWEKVIASAPFIVLNRGGFGKIIPYTDAWFKQEPHVFAKDINIPKISSTMVREAIMTMKSKGLSKEFFECCSVPVLADILSWELYIHG